MRRDTTDKQDTTDKNVELAKAIAIELSKTQLPMAELAALISTVHSVVLKLSGEALKEPLRPAVPVSKSISNDYLICLEDGRKFKSLKRHLASLGMTPEGYRAKWNLPADYPMLAPSLAKRYASNSPRRNAERSEIIARVSEWAGGKEKALEWYRGQPIAAFGDRTAESLVKSGNAEALRDYLDSIALGGFA